MFFTVLLLLVVTLAETTATTIRLPIIKRPPSYHEKRQMSNITTVTAPPTTQATKLYNDEASEYLIRVGIGSPPQNFTLALDTGSSDLWIPSKECPDQMCPLARFDGNLSTTYKSTNDAFKIVYGIGNANGTYGRDTVSIGKLQVQNQLFGLARQTDDIIAPGLNDEDIQNILAEGDLHAGNDDIIDGDEIANGIFGLGYPHLASSLKNNSNSTKNDGSFVFNLANQGLIAEPIFSIYMGSMYDKGWAGEILFGGINHEMYQNPPDYASVVNFEKNQTNKPRTYWMTYGQGIRILHQDNSKLVDHVFPEKHGFIIDTGTTLTYMDHAVANQVVQAAAGEHNVVLDDASGTYIVPCSIHKLSTRLELLLIPEKQENTTKNDDDYIVIGVPMRDLVIPLDNDDLEKATQCMFGVAPWLPSDSDTANQLGNQGFVLIGDTVLRSTYLVFDMGRDRIGFAGARGSGGYVKRVHHTQVDNNQINNNPNDKMETLSLGNQQAIIPHWIFITIVTLFVTITAE